MTQEQKAKAYDEALEKAKEMMDNCSFETTKVVCQELFPELVESEEERIRRTLLEYFGPDVQLDFVRGVAIKKIRDWLEKQKELPFVKDVVPGFPGLYFYDGERMHFQGNPATEENPYDFAMSQQEKQKEQKPAEWSEEDERILKGIIGKIDHDQTYGVSKAEMLSFLKSLRPSWKPSEDEEMLIKTSISFLKDFADTGWENAVECIDWLKSKLK